MDITLVRDQLREDGIFSLLKGPKGDTLFHVLEHSYENRVSFAPKLTDGVYTCVRGTHQLHSGPPFETFEVTGVIGHTGILFHVGNWNEDSEGCLLLGMGVAWSPKGQMVTGSREAFTEFMKLQEGVDSFKLTVIT